MENIGEPSQDGDTDTLYNPSLPSELNDDEAEGIKGDSIGDTLYSERFVLSTLLKLTKEDRPLSENEKFESDLCSLWDMTIEKDVIKLLLEHSVLEIFSNCIQNSNDPRLVEILIGTISNMCSLRETREHLCANLEITYPIMENIVCFDSLTLIQLMRFFVAALVFENSGDEAIWLAHFEQVPNFVDKFAFILSNSCNLNLLVGAIEAINTICTKFSVLDIQSDDPGSAKDFKEVFVTAALVSSLNAAFKQLFYPEPEATEDGDVDEGETNRGEMEEMVSKKKNRIMNLFLDILVILSGFDSISMEAFIDCLPETLENVSKILQPLCSPINLLPLTTNEQGIIENVNELFQSLHDPFHSDCLSQLIQIYSIIAEDNREKRKTNGEEKVTSEWEDKDAAEGISGEEMSVTLLELITRITTDVDQKQLEKSIKEIGPISCQAVFDALNKENQEQDIQICVDKFRLALKNLWKVVSENGDVQL